MGWWRLHPRDSASFVPKIYISAPESFAERENAFPKPEFKTRANGHPPTFELDEALYRSSSLFCSIVNAEEFVGH